MEKKRTPDNKEPADERPSPASFDAEEDTERRRQAFDHADDGDELPFDLPRD